MRRNNLVTAMFATFAVFLSACPAEHPPCNKGDQGCACKSDYSCADGLMCIEATCQERTCTLGEMDCACFGNSTCSATESGVQLVCQKGLCGFSACVDGEAACACRDDDSCDPGLTCDTDIQRCVIADCPPGEPGCTCRADYSCNPNLRCDDGLCLDFDCSPGSVSCRCDDGFCAGGEMYCDDQNICQINDCPSGQEGCACANGTCGHNDRGEVLSCEAGVCVAASCTPGATGCVCADGQTCRQSEDSCVEGYCQTGSCVPGERDCACLSGDCAPGLVCRDNSICVDGTGYTDGPCFSNDSCQRGNRCDGAICVQCLLGSLSCACDDAGDCQSGLECIAGLCVEEGSMGPAVPEAPICYSNCTSDLVEEDGTFRRCSADGLMEGCIGDRECNQGSCVNPGEAPTSCDDDLNCPSFQTCIEGHCYANCEVNADCHQGYSCYLRVCRLGCDTSQASCPEGLSCQTTDGEFGHCMPLAPPGEHEQSSVDGVFTLSETSLPFSNVNTSMAITLTNNSPRFETFTVRKLEHSAQFEDGRHERYPVDSNPDRLSNCDPAVDCPLFWIEMGEQGAAARVQEFEVGVDGNGSQVQIVFQGAGDYNATHWSGRFEVSSPHLPTQHISAEYIERPEGRWMGNVYYFGQFGTTNLAQWQASPDSRSDASRLDLVGNAFIKKWGAFRTGNLSWDEFLAILTATKDETWRWPSVRGDCEADPVGACYLTSSNATGLETYTSDLNVRPIPTGVVELPFAVNLYQPSPDSNPELLEGRIESQHALQYAGNPAFHLQFSSDPASCENNNGGSCKVFLANLNDDPSTTETDETQPMARIFVGGRYTPDVNSGACDQNGYLGRKEPWLVPGFNRATGIDLDDGILKRPECRDELLPFSGTSGDPSEDMRIANRSLAASNPIPDGRTRQRTLKLVDGALINQSIMLIIFEESFSSFLPDDDDTFSAYGYMLLQREASDLDLDDANNNSIADVYEGAEPTETRDDQEGRLDVACSESLLNEALNASASNDRVTNSNVKDLVAALITGRTANASVDPIPKNSSSEQVHYLCFDTGKFDGGRYDFPDPSLVILDDDACTQAQADNPQMGNNYNSNGHCDDGGEGSETAICEFGRDVSDCGHRTAAQANPRVDCPPESQVRFFTADPGLLNQTELAKDSCQAVDEQSSGTCTWAKVEAWKNAGKVVQLDPHWECTDGRELYCDRNRKDLREGKIFYQLPSGTNDTPYTSMYADIYQAFRYKVRFRSRNGSTLGFAPQICDGTSDQVPYCYDPQTVERVRERADCLLYIWRDFYDAPEMTEPIVLSPGDPNATPPIPASSSTARELLDDYLCANVANTEACHPEMDQSQTHDGFERLYTELLVMMGDESYTQAFASRFDLAGQNARSFQGTQFEDGGINLSGPAGFEMYSLYQAAQYYQEALDRFYGMSPLLWQALSYGIGEPRNFVSNATVTSYIERVIRASTQKARTWSQIAQRYQNINEPGLARRVVERAYTSTYLESIVLSQLMGKITHAISPDDVPAINMEIEKAQRRYRMALLDMRNVYSAITEDINYFGFSPDYIPFPTLSNQVETSAFEVILGRAKNKILIAKERENDALNRNRAFETDAEEFQAELVKLRTNYENQLGDVCGTFEGQDGRIYPAIASYADLNTFTRRVGNPCGTVGNGSINQAMSQYESYLVDLKRIRTSFDNVLQEIEIERSRVSAQCGLIYDIAKYKYDWGQGRAALATTVSLAHATIAQIDRAIGYTGTIAGLSKCFVIGGTAVGSNCPAAAATTTIFSVASIAGGIAIAALDVGIAAAEQGISQIDLSTARWETERQCDSAVIDSNARMAGLALRLNEIQLEALRAQYTVTSASSDIQRQLNLAKRLEQELSESEQFAINVQAARNDPNVRIYRNDAFINADLSFKDALQEAYRATKVYEYYTSQSYAKLEQLFLIRMVQFGDYNLSNYIAELENEYYLFEEEYGLPDSRVAILSLRDDILNIPRVDDLGRAYSKNERIDLMRQALADPGLLDKNGYLTIGFATNSDKLSPLTRNHKILYLEAELIGSEVGDTVGRVYLRQQGTSLINSLTGEKKYYRFPERLAVINPFFNGTRVFDKDIYRNNRMRDRPYINTSWELVLNQRDELVNQDINLQSLTDIRVNVYYTDFTSF